MRVWCEEQWDELTDEHYGEGSHPHEGTSHSRSATISSVPAVTVSGPLDLAKGETKRFKVAIKLPANIQLRDPVPQRSGSSSYSGGSRYTPYTRNHRRAWHIGAELHTDGLNLDDQREIYVEH